jgi:hypothetical protein
MISCGLVPRFTSSEIVEILVQIFTVLPNVLLVFLYVQAVTTDISPIVPFVTPTIMELVAFVSTRPTMLGTSRPLSVVIL